MSANGRQPWDTLIERGLLITADQDIDTVLMDGEVMVEGGRITRFDEDDLYCEVSLDRLGSALERANRSR